MLDEVLESTTTRYAYSNRKAVAEDQPLDFHSPYGCSKGAADQYVREYSRMYGLPTVVFRMSCIAGEMQYGNEDQGWVAHFLYTTLRGAPLVIYGDGRQVRDVLYVGDLVRAFDAVRLSLPKTAGQIYNVGGGPENTVSLVELIDQICAMTGKRLRYSHERRRPGDQLIYVSDYSKLAQHTGWKAKASVRETLLAIYTFWRAHPEIFGEAPATREVEAPLAARLGLLERTA
jgi:CDP-paratose 2-epimerase